MIFVECRPDKLLIKRITGISKIIHEAGKARICNKLNKYKGVIAVLDEDPGRSQHPYFNNLRNFSNREFENCPDIKVLTDFRGNFVVLICPRLEDFVINVARRNKIDLKSFNLPSDPDKLHEIINLNLEKFEKLLDSLKNTKEFKCLGNIINTLLNYLK